MKNWDMVKIILFASFLFSVAGLGLYAYQNYDLAKLEKEIPLCAGKLSRVGELGAEVDLRRQEIDRDKRQGLALPRYVENQSNAAGVSYGSLDWNPMPEDKNRNEGYEDRPVEFKQSGKVSFDRRQMSKLIFLLENNTNRLKVTELNLDKPSPNREEWKMNFTLTERAPIEK